MPLKPQPIDLNSFEGLQFVWLDRLVFQIDDEYTEISKPCQWEMFRDDEDRCVDFIRNQCIDKRVFFVTSGSLGVKVVPQVHNLAQVYGIYVICQDVPLHLQWTQYYPKIRIVTAMEWTVSDEILAVDILQSNIDWGDALFNQGDRERARLKYTEAVELYKKCGIRYTQQIVHMQIEQSQTCSVYVLSINCHKNKFWTMAHLLFDHFLL